MPDNSFVHKNFTIYFNPGPILFIMICYSPVQFTQAMSDIIYSLREYADNYPSNERTGIYMKILLANPETSRNKYDFAGIIDDEPYELECIMSYLKSLGIECMIWDGQVKKNFREVFDSYAPDFVFFCGRTRQENFIKEYCRYCKSGKNSRTHGRIHAHSPIPVTIVGGIHAQNCPERFHEDAVDYVVTTFDPAAVADIVLGKNPEEITGIHYKASGQASDWLQTENVPYDIRQLPWADRSLFYENSEKYCYLELRPCAIIRTAFSCPYSCAFCYRNRLNCGKYVARDIEDVVNEIASINCENIYIIDDDFLVNPKRLEHFIELIKEKGIHKKYVCFGRADFIVKYPEIIKQLAEIGFYYILTGLEYIENKRLKDTNKKSAVNANGNAIRILHENGIHMMGMFITDLDFTAHDFRNLYRWIKHFDLKHVAISIYTPEMCLENFKDYKDRLITENPEEWDYLHLVAKPDKISVRRYYLYYHLLLIRLFLRAKRQGIYDFMDYSFFIKSFLKNLFSFGGKRDN